MQKMSEGIRAYSIEFDGEDRSGKMEQLKKNPLLLSFIGDKNAASVEKELLE